MKATYWIILLLLFSFKLTMACDACKKQQPKITQDITHGSGPNSNWDWVIVSVMVAVTLATLFFSLKYLIKPGEKNTNHIKQTILS